MAPKTVADHLALMARSGLMTHIAEIAPPLTAERLARFRADAAAQAGNVMAVGAGRFALSLGPGRHVLTSEVPHRLRPIEEAAEAAAEAPSAPPVADRPAPPDTGADATQDAGHALLAAVPPRSSSDEGVTPPDMAQIATAISDLAQAVARIEAQQRADADRVHAAIESLGSRLGRSETALSALPERCAQSVAETLGGRVEARLDALEAALGEGTEAAHAAQIDAVAQIGDDLRALSGHQAEAEGRIAAAVATLGDEVRALAACVAADDHRPAGTAGPAQAASDPEPVPAIAPSTRPLAEVTPLHPAPARDNRTETDDLRRALSEALARLGPAPTPAQPLATAPAAADGRAVWRRSVRAP